MTLNHMEKDKLALIGLSSVPRWNGNKPFEVVKDPYRKDTKAFTQVAYRDGFVVWNYEMLKWDYFNEEVK